MNIAEYFRLSINALMANKMRSILTTLGVIIGVFSVILLVSLGSGLQSYITNQISELGSNILFVIPGKIGGTSGPGETVNRLTLTNVKYLSERLQGIALVSPQIGKTTTIKFANKSNKNTNIWGVSANFPDIIKTKIIKGTFFTKSQEKNGSKVVVIGPTIVKNLFPNTDPIGKKITISGGKYTIIGLSASRGSSFGQNQDNIVVIPFTAAKKQFSIDIANQIYLSANSPALVNLVKKRAKEVLLTRLDEEDFTIMGQEQILSTVTNITNVLTIALGGIAAISLLVGGIGVMNIMLVSVTERTKEIGLRKALGARRQDILTQFLLEAVMLSLLGGTIGILLGIGASMIVAVFFVAVVTPWSVILAFLFSVAVGVIFGMTPAIRASKLSPIEALRYE
ncbi:ABC transporter permease [Patescibacteria group bacterium]|nr:ABC transporter permease [Patescibacteria group bacterium]MBU4016449.1 ABC transporter permease [Patescibacteria group bacterium]MBU4098160.1 ABC transporter permease [Patescibacteria group bacterium]